MSGVARKISSKGWYYRCGTCGQTGDSNVDGGVDIVSGHKGQRCGHCLYC